MTTVTSIKSAAMLIELNISVYSGRKLDKKVSKEVNNSKGAGSAKASSVSKHLFADDETLEAIVAYAAKVRAWLYSVTMPWSDSGVRLLPTSAYIETMAQMGDHEREFFRLVDAFVANYSTKVTAQAFKLGALFEREEYPDAADIAKKFNFRHLCSPVPDAGDFRVDIGDQAAADLTQQFNNQMSSRLQQALAEPWERIHEQVSHMRSKLADTPDGKAQRLYGSMLEQANALVDTLGALNITNDPALREAQRMLAYSLENIGIDSLRESPELRHSLASKLQDFSDKFNLDA